MINGKINEIYQLLREYIVKKSKYNPSVLKNVIDNKYPLVVFENNINTLDYRTQDRYRIDQVRSLSFEINIFAITLDILTTSSFLLSIITLFVSDGLLFAGIETIFPVEPS